MTDFNKRLRKAATSGSEIELKELLRASSCDALAKDKDGWTALMHATYGGRDSCVRLLLPASDALAQDKDGWTALMRAAYGGSKSCVRLLLLASDALAQDKGGWTALMHAAYGGYEACVRLLMPESDPCAKTERGLTASDLAGSRSLMSLVQFIDAYVLAQNERTNIDAAASPGALRCRVALRV